MSRRAASRPLATLLLLACCSRSASARSDGARELLRAFPLPIPVLERRNDIAALLEREKLMVGAELGVLQGAFAAHTLANWPSAMQYVLVDLWAPQENYKDLANADNGVQETRLSEAKAATAPWAEKVMVCRNFTTACAARFPRGHFDYVYVDARHDRKGVLEDLQAWWPLVRPDGLVCGHDFVAQKDGPQQTGQDWTKNFDGTVDATGRVVRGAVEDFALRHHRQIQITYRENDWPSWCIRR